ncbi:DUF4286 family protein [Paraburkholderia phenazinium]|jgi:hypothetical protein|uniref:Uncharacterized protein n=1 Tax=Paraburkholderia phenazinium TaxID=60549 RepID=A0A1N6KRQ8_9BURK|nr:hypothetical protein SAMN05444165_4439 [Paraburkholderia phenazinium]
MSMTPPRGQLCIWTDTDPTPALEADFNAWYDREHMQERVAIPGFRYARRFKSNDGGPRRYLALYVTDTLEVFRSAAYRQAFTVQTQWSLDNFARMVDTQRRVGELTLETGDGEGAHLALVVLPPERVDAASLRPQLETGVTIPGIHGARLFCTTPALSVPLNTSPDPATALPAADALILVEGSNAAATRALAEELAAEAGVSRSDVRTFDLLWRIAA